MNVFGRAAVSRAPRRTTARTRSVESELVVHLPLLRIRKDVVGFLNLFEFFFRGFIARIEVRMVLAREFAIGPAKFLHGNFARDSQQFVVVLFGGCGHSISFRVLPSAYSTRRARLLPAPRLPFSAAELPSALPSLLLSG